jgi:hypothetical protein
MLFQWAKIKYGHYVTYNKLRTGANSPKQLPLSYRHYHESPLFSPSPIYHLSSLKWPPILQNCQSSLCQPWDNIQHLKKILFRPTKVFWRLSYQAFPP